MPPHRASLFLALALVLAVPSGAATPNGKVQIVHLDVGQGDGAVIISPLGQVAMIDDGGAIYPSVPCSSILAQLDSLEITHIDYHFASHYHEDHIGCFSTIDYVVRFDQGWDRGGSLASTAYTTYANALGVRRHTLTKGQVFTLDSGSEHPVTITCVDFDGTGTDDYENSKSVLLRVDYGHFSEAFGGDLTGSTGTGRIDRETPFSAEMDTVMVYKVHHHSSKYSTNDTWLNRTAPKAAIISLGDNNPYSFPTPETMGRLHSHQVHTYWTERGSTSGVAPNPTWDKVAHGRITITATWEGQGKTVISGGHGASAFSDTLINPGPPPMGACCNLTAGSCSVTSHANCITPRVWRGEATICAPDLCLTTGIPALADTEGEGFFGAVPNPFESATTLWYRLSRTSHVLLEIFDAGGHRVRTFDVGQVTPGAHSVDWDGRGLEGGPVTSGVFFARLSTADSKWTRTLVRIK